MYFLHPKVAWGLLTMLWRVIERGIESEMTLGIAYHVVGDHLQ